MDPMNATEHDCDKVPIPVGVVASFLELLSSQAGSTRLTSIQIRGWEARIRELKPGGMRPTDIARTLGIGRSSVTRRRSTAFPG